MNEHEEAFKISDACIAFKGGGTARFRFPIAEALMFDDIAVVRLDLPPGQIFNENVYGLNRDGRIVWQVPARTYVYEDSPYVNLARAGAHVILTNWDGMELALDPASGQILSERETR